MNDLIGQTLRGIDNSLHRIVLTFDTGSTLEIDLNSYLLYNIAHKDQWSDDVWSVIADDATNNYEVSRTN